MLGFDEQRAALRKTIPAHTVQTASPIAFMNRHCSLPELSSEEHEQLVAHVITELQKGPLLQDSQWPGTKIDDRPEGDIFKNLEPIVAAIDDICVIGDDLNDKTSFFDCDGSRATNSEIPGSSFKVDAQFILLDRCTPPLDVVDPENDKVDTVDISPAEFKKDVTDRADNEIKLASAANHTLFNDYSRRFVIEFTIEGVEMRFWYFSRSHIAVSPAFDYHKSPELFVRFIIFMTFGDRIGLGYDPTVTRIRDAQNKIQYQFEVEGKFYLTESFIAESAANDIVTRATRVWSVREYDPVTDTFIGLDSVVLKDVWLFSDAKSEKTIYDEIFSALKEVDDQLAAGTPYTELGLEYAPKAPLVEEAWPYFMDIIRDVAVTFPRGSIQYGDIAPAPQPGYTQFSYAPQKKSPAAVLGKAPGFLRAEVGKDEAPAIVDDGKESPTPIHDHPERTHRRIIFKHRCTTIYELFDYAEYAFAITYILQGLNYLRLAGYVHRDISPGNCLVFRDPSSGEIEVKISDLEYARPYGAESLPLTGTPGFMAVEYQCLHHLFLPVGRTPQPLPSTQFRWQASKSRLAVVTEAPKTRTTTWFRFNYLHDIESALWLYCWLLFYRLPSSITDRVSRAQCDSIALFGQQLFGPTFLEPTSSRRGFMDGLAGLGGGYDKVRELLRPFYCQDEDYGLSILGGLEQFELLASFYRRVEESTPLGDGYSLKWADNEFLPSFYSVLQSKFFQLSVALKDSNLQAKPINKVARLKRVALAAAVDEDEEKQEQEVRPSKRARLQES